MGDSIQPFRLDKFKGAVDETFVDIENISPEFVSKTTNLSPFRKIGSLVQCPGLSLVSYPTYPTPTGYEVVDIHTFSVDRDNKDITMLVMEKTGNPNIGAIKMYITPYWNPTSDYSNHNPNETAGAWINKWLELTEFYTGTVSSLATNTFASTDLTPSITGYLDDYFKGWFAVNTTIANTVPNKYNFITGFEDTGSVFTTLMNTTGWSNTDAIRFYRFPVVYMYHANIPQTGDTDYSSAGAVMKGKPTQFIYHQGQLRMPCGKEYRPLVLDMIYKRSYFTQASTSLKYDGFWFDFQQPVQSLYKSLIVCDTVGSVTNSIATNLFLGTYLTQPDNGSFTNAFATIITIMLDNRNEVIAGHGICTYSSVSAENAVLSFNAWFTRKLTHINKYRRVLTGTGSSLEELTVYPYFSYHKDIKINELPLLETLSTESTRKSIQGETNLSSVAYVISSSSGYWYLYITNSNVPQPTPSGFKFIVNTNRYIDQDITMNYTRATFMPQTNGRFFMIGVKNTVEQPVYENDDAVHFNTYAVGVSSYDIFTRDRYVDALAGDKYYNVDIFNFKGALMVLKQEKVVFLDVNTEDEINYRIVDSFIGRGALDYNSLCWTNYGIVIPAKDTVYLLNDKGMTPILTAINGRLQFYRDTFVGNSLNTVYYNDYNEIMIFRVDNNASYVMVYNFENNHWTDYEYGKESTTGTRIKRAITNADQNVILLNYNSINAYNIVKVDEASYVFVNTSGTSEDIIFEFETHSLALSSHLFDLNMDWISLIFGLKTVSATKLLVTETRKIATANESFPTSYNLQTYNTADTKLTNNLMDVSTINSLFQNIKINITNKISSTKYPHKYFSLDGLILWLTKQQRPKENKVLP